MVTPLAFSKRRLPTSRTFRFIGGICLFTASLTLGSATPDELWNQSQLAFKNNRPEEACSSLKEWVSFQETHNIHSAEALYNLSLCSWQLKDRSQSVVYALKSLALENSTMKRWGNLKLLQNLQKEIGIRDNLPSRSSFIFRLLPSPNASILFISAGFWFMVGTFLFKKTKKQIYPLFMGSALSCWILALIFLSLKNLGGPIGVISSSKETPIVEFDKSGNTRELMELPPGTLIEMGTVKNELTQILKPIGGWIKSESIETIIP